METEKNAKIRPTKKQRELLSFIEQFIAEHGYSPSYREIMRSLNYTSVATVALHVSNLVKRGHLRKRDHSARSLEVVAAEDIEAVKSNNIKASDEKWLVEQVDFHFASLESKGSIAPAELDKLYVLIGALRVLGLEAAVQSFLPRLSDIKAKSTK